MNKAQKKLIEPHAEHYYAMNRVVGKLSDDELVELLEATYAASTTNCGWAIYEASQYLKKEIETEQAVRARTASVTADQH